MKLSRPRFSVRRLMVAVAVSAVIIVVGIELGHRRERFKSLAMHHWGQSLLAGLRDDDAYRPVEPSPEQKARTADVRRKVGYHHQMMDKYRRAARYPWLPVTPDPPEPE